MTTSPSAIPTLANLYTSREIPLPEDRPQYQYDEELNKRVSIWRGRSRLTVTPVHTLHDVL